MGFIDLKILIIVGDVNLVGLVHPSCINGLLAEDVGPKIDFFLKSCL